MVDLQVLILLSCGLPLHHHLQRNPLCLRHLPVVQFHCRDLPEPLLHVQSLLYHPQDLYQLYRYRRWLQNRLILVLILQVLPPVQRCCQYAVCPAIVVVPAALCLVLFIINFYGVINNFYQVINNFTELLIILLIFFTHLLIIFTKLLIRSNCYQVIIYEHEKEPPMRSVPALFFPSLFFFFLPSVFLSELYIGITVS